MSDTHKQAFQLDPSTSAIATAGLAGASAGALQGWKDESHGGTRLATILRALGYGGASALGTAVLMNAIDSNLKSASSDDPFAPIDTDKSAMDKSAVVLAPLAILSALGAAYSAYQAQKHIRGAYSQFTGGESKEGWKELGRAAIESIYAIPMLRGAGLSTKMLGRSFALGAKGTQWLRPADAGYVAGALNSGRGAGGVGRFSEYLPGFAKRPSQHAIAAGAQAGKIPNTWMSGAMGGSALGAAGGYLTSDGTTGDRLRDAALYGGLGAMGGGALRTPIGRQISGGIVAVPGYAANQVAYGAGRVLPKSFTSKLVGTAGSLERDIAGKVVRDANGQLVFNKGTQSWLAENTPALGKMERLKPHEISAFPIDPRTKLRMRPPTLSRALSGSPSQWVANKYPGSAIGKAMAAPGWKGKASRGALDIGGFIAAPMAASAVMGPGPEPGSGLTDNPGRTAALYGAGVAGSIGARAIGGMTSPHFGGGYRPNTYFSQPSSPPTVLSGHSGGFNNFRRRNFNVTSE